MHWRDDTNADFATVRAHFDDKAIAEISLNLSLRHPIPETPAPEMSSQLFPLKSSGFASDYQLTLKWQGGQSFFKKKVWPFLNKQKQVFTFV